MANPTHAAPERRGNFNWQVLTGTCAFQPSGLAAGEALHGLPFQFTTVYGTLRAADGTAFTLTRRVTRGDGGPGRLILQQATPAQPHYALHPSGRTTARGNAAKRQWDGRSLTFSATGGPDKPFELSCGHEALTWREADLMDLSGSGIGPGLQYYMPWLGGGLLYTSHYYLLHGEILGKAVRGFVCLDDTYKPDVAPTPGQKHSPNPLVEHGLGVAIFNWANHFSDGTSDIGLFAMGHHGFGVGLYANTAGEVIATPDVEGRVHVGADGRTPATIDFDLAKRRWTFERDARGTMPGIASDALELDGVMRARGETRTSDVWFCWGQSFPNNGLQPQSGP